MLRERPTARWVPHTPAQSHPSHSPSRFSLQSTRRLRGSSPPPAACNPAAPPAPFRLPAPCAGGGGYSAADEKQLGLLQRQVRDKYADGDYTEALESAEESTKCATALYGSDHPVTASCMNNAALIHKALGQFDGAWI